MISASAYPIEDDVRERNREREPAAPAREGAAARFAFERVPSEVHPNGAGRHAEHRGGNREER
jgi:hypothetical protein